LPSAEITTVRIHDVVKECENVFTIRFPLVNEGIPGQFLMVWAPSCEQLPMSLSYVGNDGGITFKVIGEGTKALSLLKKGDVMESPDPQEGHTTSRAERPLWEAEQASLPLLPRLNWPASLARR